jgi:cation diffusion facilitator CzcD-associated flavoprotein CzcO
MHRACSIAIVGGGISGLSCAHKLLQLLPNAQVNVIDMGRSGPGGDHHLRRIPATLQMMSFSGLYTCLAASLPMPHAHRRPSLHSAARWTAVRPRLPVRASAHSS